MKNGYIIQLPRYFLQTMPSLMTAALHGMGIVLFPDWLIGEAFKKVT